MIEAKYLKPDDLFIVFYGFKSDKNQIGRDSGLSHIISP
jgi:hypothetical protein